MPVEVTHSLPQQLQSSKWPRKTPQPEWNSTWSSGFSQEHSSHADQYIHCLKPLHCWHCTQNLQPGVILSGRHVLGSFSGNFSPTGCEIGQIFFRWPSGAQRMSGSSFSCAAKHCSHFPAHSSCSFSDCWLALTKHAGKAAYTEAIFLWSLPAQECHTIHLQCAQRQCSKHHSLLSQSCPHQPNGRCFLQHLFLWRTPAISQPLPAQ